jgi:hypothetical protein
MQHIWTHCFVSTLLCHVSGSGEGSPIVFLASLKAAGLGSNLTVAVSALRLIPLPAPACTCLSTLLPRGAGSGEGSPIVFLASLKAAGLGTNLTAGSHVHMMDPWWNPAVEDQAMVSSCQPTLRIAVNLIVPVHFVH